jgi:xanthine dehydrogenase iron-sulfur cluster and FAD-binding subunit A
MGFQKIIINSQTIMLFILYCLFQKRLVESHGLQCGYCTPGVVMTLYTLFRNNPHPTRAEFEQALEGS